MSAADKSWEKFLHPGTLRTNLIAISLFITAYETFKARVIEKPETFFCDGFDENGLIISNSYQAEVLSKNKNKLYASLLWLKEQGGIEQSDIEEFDAVRVHRNELAHEPLTFLASHGRDFDISKFHTLVALLTKIEKWWVSYFELAVNPEMLPDGADPGEIVPGPIWSLQLLLDIALGNEPEEGYYYNAYMQRKA
jgi:hypothetical protein